MANWFAQTWILYQSIISVCRQVLYDAYTDKVKSPLTLHFDIPISDLTSFGFKLSYY